MPFTHQTVKVLVSFPFPKGAKVADCLDFVGQAMLDAVDQIDPSDPLHGIDKALLRVERRVHRQYAEQSPAQEVNNVKRRELQRLVAVNTLLNIQVQTQLLRFFDSIDKDFSKQQKQAVVKSVIAEMEQMQRTQRQLYNKLRESDDRHNGTHIKEAG